MIRRAWNNPAHAAVPLWRLCAFGFGLGVAAMGLAELLLMVSA